MAQPTINELYDNQTLLINSATLSGNTLTITFAQPVTPIQTFGAILQSGHKWFVSNTDAAVNIGASAPSTNSTQRNGLPKGMTSFSFQVYTPLPEISINPLEL